MTEEGLQDAERRRFNRLALAPSLIVLFLMVNVVLVDLKKSN